MEYIFFLGSNPALSATECLRALKGRSHNVTVITATDQFLMAEISPDLPDNFLASLGGCSRIGIILGQQEKPWQAEDIIRALSPLPPKFRLGLSVIGIDADIVRQSSFDMKKIAREYKSRLKFVLPKKGGQLSSAQVFFNRLQQPPNAELTIIFYNNRYYLARTTQVQNIPAYEKRDTSRPARDQVVGMLPPKLAQIMINIATSEVQTEGQSVQLFDPFCGGGTMLQEAWLMGHKSSGSDSNPVMVAAAQKNLQSLSQLFAIEAANAPTVFVHDATHPFPRHLHNLFDVVVTEPYLGKALRAPLPPAQFKSTVEQLRPLYQKAFENVWPLLKPNGRLLFLLPAWRQSGTATPLVFPQEILDDLAQIGYSQATLIPSPIESAYNGTQRGTLIYGRPQAFVGREITLWQKRFS